MSELAYERSYDAVPAATLAGPSPWRQSSVRLTLIFGTLICLGLVMTASAAAGEDFRTVLTKRIVLTGLGLGAFFVGIKVHYQWWRRHHLAILALALAGLVAVFVPGLGVKINHARRWINPGLPVGLQPSEFAKIAVCIWIAAYCEMNILRMKSPVHGFLVPLAVAGFASVLIVAEPDFGTAVLTGMVAVVMLLAFGMRLFFLLLAVPVALPLVEFLVIRVPYRFARVMTFLDPWRDPQGSGYQLIQSKIAIGSGGLFGTGLGAGLQKNGFLPEPHNDFIFSTIAEELGLFGSLLVIGLFLLLLWECAKVVLRARDPFGFALALGLSWLIGIQAAAHIAVTTGAVPTKGLSLPFISAGGSSLMASMFAAGVLINIALSQERPGAHALKTWQEDTPGYTRAFYAMVGRAGEKLHENLLKMRQR